MPESSFSTTTTVDRPPEAVFDAICRPRDWWSTSIQGTADTIGAEFTFDSPGRHFWKMRVTELTRPAGVVWQVTEDSTTDFVADRAEWNGTTVSFELDAVGEGTSVRFTHHGLVPSLECFSDCSTGWSGYIEHSLRNLLNTGTGQPGEF